MEKDKLSRKIMQKIALKEGVRLKKNWMICLPILLLLTVVFIFSFQHAIYHLIRSEVFKALTEVDYNENIFFPNFIKNVSNFWIEVEKEILLLLIVSIIAIAAILIKTDLLSFPKRLKEVQKYSKN